MLQKRGYTVKSAPRHAPWEIRFYSQNPCPILGRKNNMSTAFAVGSCHIIVRCRHPADIRPVTGPRLRRWSRSRVEWESSRLLRRVVEADSCRRRLTGEN